MHVQSVKEEAISKATQIIKKLSQQVQLQDEEMIYYREQIETLTYQNNAKAEMVQSLQRKIHQLSEDVRHKSRSKENPFVETRKQSIDTANWRMQRTEASETKKGSTPKQKGKSYFVSNLSFKAVLNEVRNRTHHKNRSDVVQKDVASFKLQDTYPSFSDEQILQCPNSLPLCEEHPQMYLEDLQSTIVERDTQINDLNQAIRSLIPGSSEESLVSLIDRYRCEMTKVLETMSSSLCHLTALYRSIDQQELQDDLDALQEPMSFSSTTSLIEYQRGILENVTPRLINYFLDVTQRFRIETDEQQQQIYKLIEAGQFEQEELNTQLQEVNKKLSDSQRQQEDTNKLVYRLHHENQQLTHALLQAEELIVEKESAHRLMEEELRNEIIDLQNANKISSSQIQSLKKFVDNIDNPNDDLYEIETVQSISVQRAGQCKSKYLKFLPTIASMDCGSDCFEDNSTQKRAHDTPQLRRLGITTEDLTEILTESCQQLFQILLSQYDTKTSIIMHEIMSYLANDQYELSRPFTNLVQDVLYERESVTDAVHLYNELLQLDQNVQFDKDIVRLFHVINRIGDHYINRRQARLYFEDLMSLKCQLAQSIESWSQTCVRMQHRIGEAISIGSQFAVKVSKKSVIGSITEVREDGELVMNVLKDGIRKAQKRYEERKHRSSPEELSNLLIQRIQEETTNFRNALKLFDLNNIRNLTHEAVQQTNTFILEVIETALKLSTEEDVSKRIKSENSDARPPRRVDLQTIINELLVELSGYKMAFNVLCYQD